MSNVFWLLTKSMNIYRVFCGSLLHVVDCSLLVSLKTRNSLSKPAKFSHDTFAGGLVVMSEGLPMLWSQTLELRRPVSASFLSDSYPPNRCCDKSIHSLWQGVCIRHLFAWLTVAVLYEYTCHSLDTSFSDIWDIGVTKRLMSVDDVESCHPSYPRHCL